MVAGEGGTKIIYADFDKYIILLPWLASLCGVALVHFHFDNSVQWIWCGLCFSLSVCKSLNHFFFFSASFELTTRRWHRMAWVTNVLHVIICIVFTICSSEFIYILLKWIEQHDKRNEQTVQTVLYRVVSVNKHIYIPRNVRRPGCKFTFATWLQKRHFWKYYSIFCML